MQAFEAGEQWRLHRGEIPGELPEALKQWLSEGGRLARGAGEPGRGARAERSDPSGTQP